MARRYLLSAALAFSALLAGCGDEEAPPMPSPTVNIASIEAKPVTLTRELPGRVASPLIAEVRPQVTGIIQDRLFTEGAEVKAGQVLYQLDDAIYQADANSAKAALARAKATLESARLKARRMAELAKIDAVSTQDNEDAIAALAEAEADVGLARADVKRSQVVLGFARITAPINGRIGKSAVTQGALVTADQETSLATIQQLDPIYVDLNQSSSELLQLRQQVAEGALQRASDLPVTLILEDGSSYPHSGKLTFADISVEPTTGSFTLRVLAPNPDHLLLPGMYVRAQISTGKRENAVLAPQQSISRDPKGNTSALVVDDENKVQLRQVRVSQTIGDQWLVEEGLIPGDRVIVEGLQKVAPGMRVQVAETSTTASTIAPSVATPAADSNTP